MPAPDSNPICSHSSRVVCPPLCSGIYALIALACQPIPTGPPSTIPTPRKNETWWVERHNQLRQHARSRPIDILFLGDSITQGWHGQGRDPYEGDGLTIWNQRYAPLRAANFGMGSDRTENLLWRIRHGELGHAKPKLVILLIGTNNLLDDSPEEVAAGVHAILKDLRQRLPQSRILLLGILPRGIERNPGSDLSKADSRVPAANRLIRQLADPPRIQYLDLGPAFLNPDGRIPRELMPDFLHLSRQGYATWAKAMHHSIQSILYLAD